MKVEGIDWGRRRPRVIKTVSVFDACSSRHRVIRATPYRRRVRAKLARAGALVVMALVVWVWLLMLFLAPWVGQ